jgi:hypothetical protein
MADPHLADIIDALLHQQGGEPKASDAVIEAAIEALCVLHRSEVHGVRQILARHEKLIRAHGLQELVQRKMSVLSS